MRRTTEEIKTEIFRRRDEYLKKRKARIFAVSSLAVPLAIFAVICSAVFPRDIFPYVEESVYFGKTEEVHFIVLSDEAFLSEAEKVDFVEYGKDRVIPERTYQDEIISFMREFTKSASLLDETESITESNSEKPLYVLRFFSKSGEMREYAVYQNYIVSTVENYLLSQSDFEFLKEILERS